MRHKLSSCICGKRPNGYSWASVYCPSCTREVSGVDKKDACMMWNALMTALVALTEPKND